MVYSDADISFLYVLYNLYYVQTALDTELTWLSHSFWGNTYSIN